ncbi:unnamed protein product [marine sediment metagenome]|uniref:Uncharacterized protein n=1 Tax=marine sediment metagenome TaxID=412755 RepID=X1D2V1_9ZZZZ
MEFNGNLAIFIAVVLAILAAARLVGELFIKIGNMGKFAASDNDWFDSAGAVIMHCVETVGKFLAYFGVGNKQK